MTKPTGEPVARGWRTLLCWLAASGAVALAVFLGGASYVLRQPCPRIEPTLEIASKALDKAYDPSAAGPVTDGALASRTFCRLDALLRPIWGDRLTHFMFAVPDREGRQTYYVFTARAVATYYVYIVQEGEVMARAKFESGGA